MKVQELISHLEKFDPEAEICIENDEREFLRYFKLNEYPIQVQASKRHYKLANEDY